jgi:hypothetical protein
VARSRYVDGAFVAELLGALADDPAGEFVDLRTSATRDDAQAVANACKSLCERSGRCKVSTATSLRAEQADPDVFEGPEDGWLYALSFWARDAGGRPLPRPLRCDEVEALRSSLSSVSEETSAHSGRGVPEHTILEQEKAAKTARVLARAGVVYGD